MFEYLCDNILMERNRLEFKATNEKNKTLVTWSIYSRRKSLLFRVVFLFYLNDIFKKFY